ncbi:MarR family winged helix-turn-helix transcriptional regulator [Picrophilus oshimae]|uniref:Transcriptional regulator, MarR family n=1 Tax=Picrophilus torridus (strain ATCC 700027 / DSM 9790 / JCM 10055 / NBRC 100828 / KAW 2/3) TaxID=1122961 RepID=Q6KZU1_PICTO|nr:MarR family transcriptional regulator [Picrophilus oshimae]AAT43761.1 transcriptional regulator, MarR family [Picrophilus oshimae DSM 9789]SMD31388.1 transcriptional regulator, MarR family [Picrophilus oshimae DSM 9789]
MITTPKSYEVWKEFIKTWKIWYRASEKNLINLGISTVEYRILKNLYERGPLPMIELANINMVTQGWITGVVDKMEKNGYVKRDRSQNDRRVINISITEKGIEFFKHIAELHLNYIDMTLQDFTDYDMNEMIKLLQRVQENVNKLSE